VKNSSIQSPETGSRAAALKRKVGQRLADATWAWRSGNGWFEAGKPVGAAETMAYGPWFGMPRECCGSAGRPRRSGQRQTKLAGVAGIAVNAAGLHISIGPRLVSGLRVHGAVRGHQCLCVRGHAGGHDRFCFLRLGNCLRSHLDRHGTADPAAYRQKRNHQGEQQKSHKQMIPGTPESSFFAFLQSCLTWINTCGHHRPTMDGTSLAFVSLFPGAAQPRKANVFKS